MNELSNDLNVITAEINSFKKMAGQSLFEIGKRLNHAKANDLVHGEWEKYCREGVKIAPQRAWEYIEAYKQFGNLLTSGDFSSSQVFEMLSLPESVNRDDFITTEHTVPSTGATKTVDEMTVKELREVKKALQEAERSAAQAQATAETERNSARHFEKLWTQAKNQPPRIETKTVEIVPDRVKKELEEKEFQLKDLRHGYQSAKEKLKEYEMRNTVDYDAEQSQKQREKLQHEADLNTINLRIAYKQFMEKAAISAFMQGAIATASQSEKDRLAELVESAEQIINQTKLALRGRKLGVVQ